MRHRLLALTLCCALVAALTVVAPTGPPAAAGGPMVSPFTASGLTDSGSGFCGLGDGGSVWCWSDNDYGSVAHDEFPTRVPALTGATAVAHRCALMADTTVRCWGLNNAGQVGDGTTTDAPEAVPVTGLTGVVQIGGNADHACAVLDDGTVRCWGSNDFGELGDGTTTDSPVPVVVTGITDAVQVSLADAHTCAVSADGTVRCWGANFDGQLGDGTQSSSSTPVAVAGVTGAVQVAAGNGHTCALLDDTSVRCWGRNNMGQVGDGTTTTSLHPVTVSLLTGVAGLAANSDSTCAWHTDGTGWCWGDNRYGQTGSGTTDPTAVVRPTRILGLDTIVELAVARLGSTCARLQSAEIVCWGDNSLGNGTQLSSLVPVRLSDQSAVTAVETAPGTAVDSVAAGHDHSCIAVNGTVQCWGSSTGGSRGPGSPPSGPDAAVVVGVQDVRQLSLGVMNSCAVTTAGTVVCWGVDLAQMDGTAPYSPDPAEVAGLTGVEEVEVGRHVSCARHTDQTVSCWGDDRNGWLADGSPGGFQTTPAPVAGLDQVTDMDVGHDHACAVRVDTTVWCWGNNGYGQLGNGSHTPATVAAPVPGVSGAVSVEAGWGFTCAVLDDTTATCWGDNEKGPLGTTTPGIHATTPVAVSSLTGVTELTAGWDHTCALLVDTSVRCWGGSYMGQLGTGSFDNAFAPVPVPGLSGVVDLDAGAYHTCAVLGTGPDTSEVRCWGANFSGQLGDVGALDVPAPPGAPPEHDPTPLVHVPVTPARIVDTRPGFTTVDGVAAGIGRRDAATELQVDVAGRAGVPADAVAVVVNVTAVNPGGNGFVTVHPCLDQRPLASSLNHREAVTIGNELMAMLDVDGDLCVYSSADTDLTLDLVGYVPAGSAYRPLPPARLVDTRDTGETVDGVNQGGPVRPGGAVGVVTVAGRGGVPATDETTIDAVVLNVTAVNPSANGFVTVYPCGPDRPTASSLNHVAGVTRGNEIIAPLGADGTVCVYTHAPTDLTIDVVGYVPAGSWHRSIVPARLLETRSGNDLTTVDGLFEGEGRLSGGQRVELQVGGRAGVPADVPVTVVVNITAVSPGANGFVVAHPCLTETPATASLNYRAGVTGGSEVVVALDTQGRLCIDTNADTDLTVDVVGHAVWPD